MKSKFSPIVKIKKQELDKIEGELVKINNKIASKKEEINKISFEIDSINLPTGGSFSMLKLLNENVLLMFHEKKQAEHELQAFNQTKISIQQKYKQANIELEKMKYLHDIEVQKRVKELKLQEAKMLDEISVMLYKKERD
ncbi:MAG: flagellar FliJ family protein [Campylobacterales bacterium]|nr:flagellar FliJ family protein [Campylobacterales bacterium]